LLIDQTNVNNDQQILIPNLNVDSNRHVYEQCQSNLSSTELIWLQFYILIGILPSSTVGRCFVRMKDNEKFRPIIIDGIEYPHDLKLKK
ncbi:unnamed protein product, partial [Didymodactylos carnosus]